METQSKKLHIFLFPLMAQGHILPILDIAKLLAARQVKSTIITTPSNATRFAKSIQSSEEIALKLIEFPPQQSASLENLDLVTGQEDHRKFFASLTLLQQPLRQAIEELKPDGLVSDIFFPWTADLASDFRIPRLVFHGTSFFSMCCLSNLDEFQPHKKVKSDTELFSMPEFPDLIQFSKSELPDNLSQDHDQPSVISKLLEWAEEVEKRSFGMIVNSFYEIESSYADYYRKKLGRKAWHIGPVSLSSKNVDRKGQRGTAESIEAYECIKWLDSKKPNSVLYICFGTVANFSDSQLRELAIGLEASGQDFIWVVRRKKKTDEKQGSPPVVRSNSVNRIPDRHKKRVEGRNEENGGLPAVLSEEGATSAPPATTASEENWIPDRYEKRIEGKGLIIRGWAPQVLILDHESVGGFVTHCGWNSVLEGICAGLPMVTWPIFADQFFNEKLISDVVKIGVSVGAKKWVRLVGDYVESWKIEKAVKEIMVGEKAEEFRKRAKKIGEMARNCVQHGGSSYNDLSALVEDLKSYHAS